MTTQDVWHQQPDAGLRRISSKWTFFYKKVFPVFWFGIVVLVSAVGLFAVLHTQGAPAPVALIPFVGPVLLALFGYVLMKILIFDLMDEVWDGGDHLVFVNRDERATVPLSGIINVSETFLTNPTRITLLLRDPCSFGREVSFTPVRKKFFFHLFRRRSAVGWDLLERVHGLKP
ncbi:MAG: hypothetical protein KGQ70_07945 [Alphaproteobacteria bacterium]|nr:hypothetical protein [Alphaproteobacteria bacterium]